MSPREVIVFEDLEISEKKVVEARAVDSEDAELDEIETTLE